MNTLKVLRTLTLVSAVVFGAVSVQAQNPNNKRATRVADAIWADGELYGSILTQTSFKAPRLHSVDVLYNFSMSGLEGQRAVSEAGPGNPDYNGGRWWVQFPVFTEAGLAAHDPDGDGIVNFELTDAETVLHHRDLGHFIIMESDVYFVCPLVP